MGVTDRWQQIGSQNNGPAIAFFPTRSMSYSAMHSTQRVCRASSGAVARAHLDSSDEFVD